MRRTNQIALLALALSLLIGCEKIDPKYERPDWLAGKVFTQIADNSIFDTFQHCLELTGFDTIINTSGSYTVFCPDNEAFDKYLAANGYTSVDAIPMDELTKIVKYHIVQNPWAKQQLRSLDVWGWIDPTDETNDEPKGFKRETLLFDKNIKYGTKIEGNKGEEDVLITDTLNTPWSRRVVTDSRKFAPIFFKEYFDIYDLSTSDYTFYYDRPFEENSDIYYHNARVIGQEIFAENGFVYHVDRVVSPAKNAYQIIATTYPDKSYSKFFKILNQFPLFEYNSQETFDQVGADQGLEVDSLFDLTFPELTFNLTREKTKAPPGAVGLPSNVTIRYHHGMLAPTDVALEKLENQYLPGGSFWDGIENAPVNIQRIIANSHLSQNAVYRTDIEQGFYNGEEDLITLDESSIIHKEYGSNASFLGLNDPIVPRAFSSVTGPIYLRKGFARVMQAIETSGLLAALKRERDPDHRYMFFVEADVNSSLDSSFLYDAASESFFAFTISGSSSQQTNISKNDLRVMLLNHIATREPLGIARKEFILNLAGNYMIFNNITGEVSGNGQTTIGYNGPINVNVIPKRIDINADNGSTWEISNWFSYSVTGLYLQIQTKFPDFFDLIVKAGLANTKLNSFSFISESENYTVFAPSKLALQEVQADTLNTEDLKDFILSHFIRKEIIFTDGYASEGYYETLRPDETSNSFNVVNSKIYIDPNVDEIDFRANGGGSYTTIVESDSTNILAGQLITEGQATFPVMLNNAVVHKIDKALIINELDVSR